MTSLPANRTLDEYGVDVTLLLEMSKAIMALRAAHLRGFQDFA